VLGGPELAAAITTLSNFNAPVHDNGFIGGGQIGGNWQVGQVWVAGIEADIQGRAGGQGTHAFTSSAGIAGFPANSVTQSALLSRELDYLGTVRGRLGFLLGNVLFYGTAGLAYGGVSASTSITQSLLGAPSGITPPTWTGTGATSGTLVGWTGGGGAEWMFLRNWSTKVEYLHYDLGARTYAVSPLITNATGLGPFTTNAVQSNARFNGDVIRAGLNYHF
jgi:outer membrane immunogenic protein